MSDVRWGIYIDIEGFGPQYGQSMRALTPLNALMDGIFEIGTKKYFDDVSRLFAHQFGDGFVIVSCFEEKSLDRPTAIAIALMRHVLAAGGVAKASISEGGFSDIKGCYPMKIVEKEKNGSIPMGRGVLTLIPVMGTALINAVRLDKRSPSGALLTIHAKDESRLSECFIRRRIEHDLVSINWLRGDQTAVAEVSSAAGLRNSTDEDRVTMLKTYIAHNELKPAWVRTTCFEQGISI